jgi:hypothetical protein
MSGVALITVEHTLAAGDDLRTAFPLPWGKVLYDGIRSQSRTVALSRATENIARWWLNREGFASWSSVLCWNQSMSYEDWRIDVIRDFLANGWDIDFFFDADPDVAVVARSMGVLTLYVGAPLQRPGFKPEDTSVYRSWDEVAATLDPRP